MILPGFTDDEQETFSVAMNAIVKHILKHQIDLAPAEIAERFAIAVLGGERDPIKLKALTLGAEGLAQASQGRINRDRCWAEE